MNSNSSHSLDHLLLPQIILEQICHPKDYIQGLGKDKKPFRKIFKQTEYNQQEVNGIQQLKDAVKENKVQLPQNFDDSDYLKFVYTGKFQKLKGLEALIKNLEWRNSMRDSISPQALQLLKNGVFYQYGRDKQYRPIIILNIHKIDPKHNSEEHTLEALCFFLRKIQSNMFYPGKIENWIIILETNKMSFFKFPIGILKLIIQTLSVNFNATLEHLFILNPSTSFNVIWGGASSFIDSTQKEKISFIGSKKEMTKLHSKIEQSQLENKYGGQLEDIQNEFWPPKNTVKKVQGDPSLLVVEEDFMQRSQKNRQSQVDQLKGFSKDIEERLSVLQTKNRMSNQRNDNPLEDQLKKKSTNGTPSHRSIRSIKHSEGKPSLFADRESVMSGFSRPSNRTVYKSFYSNYDFDVRQVHEFQDEKEEIYHSFHTCLNELPQQDEEKKLWQKWTVLEAENTINTKVVNNSSAHTTEDKNRMSSKSNKQVSLQQVSQNSINNNYASTNQNTQKSLNERQSSNQYQSQVQNEIRNSKNPEQEQESMKGSYIINTNDQIENKQRKQTKTGERYGKESFSEIGNSRIQHVKDKPIKQKKFCC